MQIMSDGQVQYTSNQNQFQNNYKIICWFWINLCCIIAYYSKRKYLFVWRQIGSAATMGLYMNQQFLEFISHDFLSNIKMQYKETNYDADNIGNNK